MANVILPLHSVKAARYLTTLALILIPLLLPTVVQLQCSTDRLLSTPIQSANPTPMDWPTATVAVPATAPTLVPRITTARPIMPASPARTVHHPQV